MTVPHPDAVGSLGPEFVRFAEGRRGPLRWWQKLVATRLLEVDGAGELVWRTLVLSLARQLGKSWLLSELILWRVHQGERFGGAQDVIHISKEVGVAREVQRDARAWAKGQADFKVRETNGQEQIEYLRDGSRWILQARSAGYGYATSVVAVDEAWKVKTSIVDDGFAPTMVERPQSQLWLVSTAHREATALMLRRRLAALEHLEDGEGNLLIEWSAPRELELMDTAGWRLASPHWTPYRERHVREQLEGLLSGLIQDPEEPDPEESFQAQWLNRWPRKLTVPAGAIEALLPPGLWADLAEPGLVSEGSLYVGVEDDAGRGAAVAAVRRLDDGRFEVDGWLRDRWKSAIDAVRWLDDQHRVRELHVGASMIDSVDRDLPVPRPATFRQARDGFVLLRDLAENYRIVHDTSTHDLDLAVQSVKVKELAGGLQPVLGSGPVHLVKALVWALMAAHRPARVVAVR